MNTVRLALAAALAALFTFASAGVAQAYPDPSVTIEVDRSTLTGGQNLNFTARSGGVDCAWTVRFNGESLTGNGTTLSGTFNTPVVANRTSSQITANCAYQPGGNASSGVSVTLLPAGSTSSVNGALPDTGGSNVWILVGGGALVLLGGGAVIASRRRA